MQQLDEMKYKRIPSDSLRIALAILIIVQLDSTLAGIARAVENEARIDLLVFQLTIRQGRGSDIRSSVRRQTCSGLRGDCLHTFEPRRKQWAPGV
jgi:hypothetical protein